MLDTGNGSSGSAYQLLILVAPSVFERPQLLKYGSDKLLYPSYKIAITTQLTIDQLLLGKTF